MEGLDRRFRTDRLAALAIGLPGLAAFVAGLFIAPQRAWASLFVGNALFLFIAAGATVFVAWAFVFGAAWPVVFRRVPEAMSAYLPLGAAILIVSFIWGGAHLYPWMQPDAMAHDPHYLHRRAVLNPTFYLTVSVVSLALWIAFSKALRRRSRQQDSDGDIAWTRASQRLSAAFLVVFGISFTIAAFSWLMTMEPGWTSAIFPVYALGGLLTASSAAIALTVIVFARRGILPGVNESHIYELARLVVACSTFWVYAWFCQYMLIYYTNIPEEALYYARRATPAWYPFFLLTPALNWVAPTVLMLTDRARRSFSMVAGTCALVLVGQWLATVMMVMPSMTPAVGIGMLEVLVPFALVPLFVLPFLAVFQSADAAPRRDPYLAESAELAV